MRHRETLSLCAALFSICLGTSCKQGEGDRCQLDSDCDDGLVCCVDSAKVAQGGVCRPAGKCDLAPTDGGTDGKVDGGKVDGQTSDTKPSPDQKPVYDFKADSKPTTDSKPADLPKKDGATKDQSAKQ